MRLLAAALLVLALPAHPARAAEAYDNCTGFVDTLPAVITTQGTWCLRQDVSTALDTGAAIVIAANNVTLDCNHFKIGGLAAGVGTAATGVESSSRVNSTVRNCTIRGFLRGLRFLGLGSGHLVESNRFEGNTYVGLQVRGSSFIIRDNLVVDTGGSSSAPDNAFGIYAQGDGGQILDNTVTGVATVGTAGTTAGIYYEGEADGDTDIGRNWVRGQDPGTEGFMIGIVTINARAIIHENRLQAAPGVAESVGIRCSPPGAGLARANMLIDFASALELCTLSGNVVVAP